jgi:signal transduction histidine kinase
VSVKLCDIKSGDKTYLGVSVTNITAEHKQSLDNIKLMFQNTLTNAISHERLTPLNAIINGCETIEKKFKSPAPSD